MTEGDFAPLIDGDDYYGLVEAIDVPDNVRDYLRSIKRNRGGGKKDPAKQELYHRSAHAKIFYDELRSQGMRTDEAKQKAREKFNLDGEWFATVTDSTPSAIRKIIRELLSS